MIDSQQVGAQFPNLREITSGLLRMGKHLPLLVGGKGAISHSFGMELLLTEPEELAVNGDPLRQLGPGMPLSFIPTISEARGVGRRRRGQGRPHSGRGVKRRNSEIQNHVKVGFRRVSRPVAGWLLNVSPVRY